MRKCLLLIIPIALLAMPLTLTFGAGEVVIYTGTTQWIGKGAADEQAQICVDMLNEAGIKNTLYESDGDMDALAAWMEGVTDDNGLDICILYGDFPPTIYPQGNAAPDGSIAETFIETTDGDAIMNHADWMFWGLGNRNAEGGIRNMMDIPSMVMWDDNTPMVVTEQGKEIAPSLTDFASDHPFHTDLLEGDWVVEAALAQNDAGTRVDPIIVRDGELGRLIPTIQTNQGGALDMAGNLWEWVSDWYKEDYYDDDPYMNPKGPETGDGHVLKGGSWAENLDFTRCANRSGGNPGSLIRGFRCAMDVSKQK